MAPEPEYQIRKPQQFQEQQYPADTALLVVDMQNDFCDHYDHHDKKRGYHPALPCEGAHKIASLIPALAAQYSCRIASQDYHIDPGDHFTRWPRHCERGTYGAELCPALRDISWEAGIRKGHYDDGYSAFSGTVVENVNADEENTVVLSSEVEKWLRQQGITTIHIAGVALDHCVAASAYDAAQFGFATSILIDYTAATSTEVYRYFRTQVVYNILHSSKITFSTGNLR